MHTIFVVATVKDKRDAFPSSPSFAVEHKESAYQEQREQINYTVSALSLLCPVIGSLHCKMILVLKGQMVYFPFF